MIKLTVLALMTLSVLCNYQQTYPNSNPMGGSGNMQNPNGTNNPYEMENEIIAAGTVIAFILGSIVFIGVKCLNKRSTSKKIKEQMMFKRLEFATNNGLTIQQLNDPRYSQTLHV